MDGEYLIRLSLLKLSFGQVFGEGAEGEELEVTLNGERVKLFKLDEVPMFFMRESPGSHPAKPPPTDPLEERVKMTPDIRLELRLKVKAGPQTIGVAFLQKARAANEDLVRRPVSSTYDVFIGMQYGYTTAPHLSRVVITGPYNAAGTGDTPSRRRVFVCRPSTAGRRRRRARSRSSPRWSGGPIAAPRPTRTSMPLLAFYRDERAKTGSFDAGIEMALRRILADPEFIFRFEPPPAGVAGRDAVSHQRHRAGLAAVVLPLVVDSGRRAAEAGDRRPAAPAGRARKADAPDAGRSEGAGAGRRTSPTSGCSSAS